MLNVKVFDAELRLMNIIWNKEPISSNQLVSIAREKLGWNKSTTYTVIRRLCERGIIKNQNSKVESLVEREQVMRAETISHIEKIYSGSIKLLLTTFLKTVKLNEEEIEELKEIVIKNNNLNKNS